MSLRHSMEDRIAAEAWKNPQFKKELLANPRAALLKHFQMNIPDDVEISIIEETPRHIYFVLPLNPVETGSELTLEALDAVAGGVGTQEIECSPTYGWNCTYYSGPNC